MAKEWAKFPYAARAYLYEGAALKKHWGRLHRGDCEPLPKDAAAQEAWRAFHAGEFQRAVEAGLERSEEHTSELQSRVDLVCRLLLEKKKEKDKTDRSERVSE